MVQLPVYQGVQQGDKLLATASRVKGQSWVGAGNCNIPTEKIMGAQNFIFYFKILLK